MTRRVLGIILCIVMALNGITAIAEEGEYAFHVENKPVYFNEHKPIYQEGEWRMIHFYDFVKVLGFQIDGDIRNEQITLTDRHGNQYMCYLEVWEGDGNAYLYVVYGYNENNLYYGYKMWLNPWSPVGVIEWIDGELYLSSQAAEYFVYGLGRNIEINDEIKEVHIYAEGTVDLRSTVTSVNELDGMSGEYQDIYSDIRYTLLWDLLLRNFPKATMYDILDARANNPDSLYGMIKELKKFR